MSPLSPAASALTLRAGEPFVLHIALRDAAGSPQLLAGRAFGLLIAAVGATSAAIRAPSTLSTDALYAVVGLTGEQTAALYADFGARACAYAIIETVDDAQVTRSAGSLRVEASAAIPSSGDPVMMDLPYALAIPTAAGVLITETGARGLSAAEQFAIGGLDDGDPMTGAMFAALGAPALEAADTASAAADNANDKATLAQGVVDAQADNMLAIQIAKEATLADREQTNLDQIKTGQDVALTTADRGQTMADRWATSADVVTVGTARGQALAAAQIASDAAGMALASITLYENTTAGLAAVAEGAAFAVQGAASSVIYATVYRKAGGAAVYVNDFASYSALSAALTMFGASAVQNATDANGYVRVDKYGGVIEEVTPAGYRKNAFAEVRYDQSTLRVMFDESSPDVSTFTVTRLSGGNIQIGTAGTYITINPVAGSIVVPGLDLGNVIGGVTFATASGATVMSNASGGKVVLGTDASTGQIGAMQWANYGTSRIHVDKYGGVVDEDFLDGTAYLPGGFFLDGNAGKVYAPDGSQIAPYTGASSENFPAEYMARKNQAAELRAATLRARVPSPAQMSMMTSLYALIATYGQSNSCGTECHPLNYVTDGKLFGRTLGCLMMGDSVHGRSSTGAWEQCGAAALNTMIATVRNPAVTGQIYTGAEINALSPTGTSLGQTIAETALATFSFLRLGYLGLSADDRRYINYAAGVGGKTVAELSKGGSYFGRLAQGATIAKTLVDAAAGAGKIQFGAIINSQGEDDAGVPTDAETWKAGWRQIRADHHADVSAAIFGQSGAMVPMFTLQIAGPSSVSPGGMTIANAQLDLALENTGYFLIGGSRGARKGLHYGTNPTVWNGQRIGKKMFELFCLGRVPFPFAPYEIETKGNQMLVTFQVPTPPIQFLSTYAGYTLIQPGDTVHKGFYPSDATGDLTVTSVAVVGSSTVLITCNRAFGTSPRLEYGRRTNPLLGVGNLFDSNDFQLFSSAYAAGSSWRTEDASLFYTGQPFPGEEDLLLFTRPATPI